MRPILLFPRTQKMLRYVEIIFKKENCIYVSFMVSTLTIFVPKFATQKLVFCSGQIYYELLAEREKREITDVALVRIEQIAPFAFDRVAESAAKYCNAEVIWAQQEPK